MKRRLDGNRVIGRTVSGSWPAYQEFVDSSAKIDR
jgi:hypothetical protein